MEHRGRDGQSQQCGSRREGPFWRAVFDRVGITRLPVLWLVIAAADGEIGRARFATVSFDATNSSFLLIAHFAVRPIRRLHEATKLCGRPPEYREEPKKQPWWSPMRLFGRKGGGTWDAENISDISSRNSSGRRDNFRIPQKVPVGRHFVKGELTALVDTFNVMTEELLGQYEKLEEKVQERTEQLQQQTVLAESANDAKTMFITNVSHELRTPLNGILGMCSLVLEETSLPQSTRENLGVVFKSGELLLHLLTDLITFSKNQVWGAQIKVETGPFRVREFISKVMEFFTAQAKERGIALAYEVSPADCIDFVLIGDVNRILQVVIVSLQMERGGERSADSWLCCRTSFLTR